jgi:hypothetical protein
MKTKYDVIMKLALSLVENHHMLGPTAVIEPWSCNVFEQFWSEGAKENRIVEMGITSSCRKVGSL